MKNKVLERVFKWLICGLPLALFFSYYPVISFGANETMNFELSVPLVWLVIFDLVAFLILVQGKLLFKILKKWWFLLFPIYVTASLIWTENLVRGALTVLVMWLVWFAVYGMVVLKEILKEETFVKRFWRFFFSSALLICAWCFLQCILDVAGVPREYSLMCAGCTSQMFGFPHPNGFAIEPQFMGNLLLAPTIVTGWLILRSWPRPAGPSPRAAGANSRAAALRNATSLKYYAILFFIFVATLFLTFSRGAIYAFVVAMMFMTGYFVVKTKKWKAMLLWPVVILAFLFTLNLQGIMAQVSSTNDTYFSGVAKVLNHLSLGIIDVRAKDERAAGELKSDDAEATEVEESNAGDELEGEVVVSNEAVFDGYVEESTEIRKMMTRNALITWRQDLKTVVYGVGIGGAGQAMFDAGLIGSPKEIVQNEYASLLLELGVVGVALALFTLALAIKILVKKSVGPMVLTLLVAYGVTLLFFAGLANALQIYLLPVVLFVL